MIDGILYYLARALVFGLQKLPLRTVARLGRFGGGFAYVLDRRHRRVAIQNLQQCYGGDKSAAEIRAIARENLRRIGENYACGIKTASMDEAEIRNCLEFSGGEHITDAAQANRPSRIVAIGHFGNFELYARIVYWIHGFQPATTYRGLRQPGLNRLLQDLRNQSGCLYFERRTDAALLREAMNRQRLLLGLLVDQHAGDRGVPVPFFGQVCSTNAAPAILALRYNCPLHTGFCYRAGLGRWRIELGPEISTHEGSRPRPVEAILLEINQAFEAAVRRDPANWFWVHRRWKPIRRKPRASAEKVQA